MVEVVVLQQAVLGPVVRRPVLGPAVGRQKVLSPRQHNSKTARDSFQQKRPQGGDLGTRQEMGCTIQSGMGKNHI